MKALFLSLTTLAAAAAPRGREPGGSALLATPKRRDAAAGVAHRPALGARRGAPVPDGQREQAWYSDGGRRRLSATDRAWYADAVQPMDCAVMGTGPLQVRDSPLGASNTYGLYKAPTTGEELWGVSVDGASRMNAFAMHYNITGTSVKNTAFIAAEINGSGRLCAFDAAATTCFMDAALAVFPGPFVGWNAAMVVNDAYFYTSGWSPSYIYAVRNLTTSEPYFESSDDLLVRINTNIVGRLFDLTPFMRDGTTYLL